MQVLKPTVKRDISLFSVLSWQKGYTTYLKEYLDYWYHVISHYDGTNVQFYHPEKDFVYFKEMISERLISNAKLFYNLNTEFKSNIAKLIDYKKQPDKILANCHQLSDLIGQIMSFYIFIVSDKFITAQPDAVDSRLMSEGVLYEIDRLIEAQIVAHGISRQHAHIMTIDETSKIFRKQKLVLNDISRRSTEYLVHDNRLQKTTFKIFCVENDFIYPANAKSIKSLQTLRGTPTYPGRVRGVARIVKTNADCDHVNPGDIIISPMTNSAYLPALQKAAGIITDEGGITCHAAIIARELGKPCITNTKIATSMLKDGLQIDLNANNGTITIILKTGM